MKRRTILILASSALLLGIGVTVLAPRLTGTREMSFQACERAGGEAWLVDISHPDICPSCAEYQACFREVNDYSDVCPECYGPCQECQAQYAVRESCPECYGPCQGCENEHRHDFESEAERYELCPACKRCDECREEIEARRINCPPCISCNECKERNRTYTDIRDVCPQVVPCTACTERNFPYPNRCPNGKRKIGEISDAAIWFQCCK